MNRYSEYKDSGVEWVGEIPKHWGVSPLKSLCSRYGQYGANITSTHYSASEGVRFIRTTDITVSERLATSGVYVSRELVSEHLLREGDILLSRSGTIGRSFLYQSEAHGPCSYAGYLIRFSPNDETSSKYLYYFTKSQPFGNYLRLVRISSTIDNVNANKYSNAQLTVPLLTEQLQIAQYLDKKTAQIDSLVEKLERKIELLKEYRVALISHCVTKGLDPDVEMKDSGIEWIGEIPKSWEPLKLKFICATNTSALSETTTDPEYRFTYIEIGDVNLIEGITFNEPIAFHESPSRARRIVKPGDVIVSTVRTYLKAIGTVPNISDVVCSTGFCVLTGNSEIIEQKFLAYCVTSEWFIASVISNSYGVSYPAINASELIDLKVVLPSINEQQRIVNFLINETSIVNSLIHNIQQKIKLLKEYRHSLISNVVTGKVRVSEQMT